MKTHQRITLVASVLATVAIPSSLRAQASAAVAKDTPASERQLELNNAERQALRKVYQTAVEEMHKVKDEMRTNPEKRNDVETYIRAMQWVVQVETKLRKFQPSDATKVAALTKRLDEIILDYASVGNIVFQCEMLASQGKGIPFDNGINIVLMHKGKTKETWRKLDGELILHDYLKALAKEAGLVVHIGEDVVSLRLPEDLALAEAATEKPQVDEQDAELAFYEKTYGKKIFGVRPLSQYPHSREYYAAILEQLGLRDIIFKAADAKFGTGDENGPEARTLSHVGPSPIAHKPGWYIMMMCRPAQSEQEKAASQRRLFIRKLHLDYEGKVAFLEEIAAWEQAPAKQKEEKKNEELDFYEKTYGKKISHLVNPKSKYENPDEYYANIADRLGLRDIISKAADAKFGSPEVNGVELRTLARVRPSANATKPGWDIEMTCYTPKPKHENVDSAKKVMVQLLHLDYQGNVTFLDRMPK